MSARVARFQAWSRLAAGAAALALALAVMSCNQSRPPEAGSPTASLHRRPAGEDLLDQVKHAGVVRVGVKTDTAPFGVMHAGTYQGLDIDIAYALASRLGIEQVQFVPVTSADRMDLIERGEVDMVIASMSITRYRERRVDFTIPYYQDGQALLVPSSSAISGYLDLAGKSVGTVSGSSSSYYLHQVAPDCKEVVVSDFPALLALLDHGKADAITSDQTILIGLMKNAADPKAYRLAGGTFTTEPYGIAVPQNQSHWRNALNHALMELVEDGQWQSIIDSWFSPGTTFAHSMDFHPPVYPH